MLVNLVCKTGYCSIKSATVPRIRSVGLMKSLFFFWTPKLEWIYGRLVVKNEHQKDMCYEKIGFCARNLDTILGSTEGEPSFFASQLRF